MITPQNGKTLALAGEDQLSEIRNDGAKHHEKAENASGPWFRCTRCEAVSHISTMTGLSDTTRCLCCGHPAHACKLGRDLRAELAERRQLVGG